MDRDEFINIAEARNARTVFDPLGIPVARYDPDAMQVAMDVDHRHHQHLGMLHGGVSALLAESAASLAAAMSVNLSKHLIAGVDINATHLRAKRDGTLLATARPPLRGRMAPVYGVEITDERHELVCVACCTIAIRQRR